MGTWSNLLRENLFTPEQVPTFQNKLFFEGPRRRPYLERFSVLLFLATVIATVGIITDSTATVIGAMIIAPLMLPIMATAAALVMAQTPRAGQSFLLVLAGVGGVVGLAALIGWIYPESIDFTSNSQIQGRISPRLLDLAAALASGAAGAFCMSRDDIADSLPGVAIAISLVPPLCVVGLSMAYGEWAAAWGAWLLFVTNMLAILLAGGGVLAFLGLSQAATAQLAGGVRRRAFGFIFVAALLVTLPLSATGRQIIRDTQNELTLRRAAEAWLADTDFDVRAVNVFRDQAQVTITGPGEAPPVALLVTLAGNRVSQDLYVEVEVVPTQRLLSGRAGGGE